MTTPDYYFVLGVERTADAIEIKKAYRVLARKFHPDRNDGDVAAAEEFKRIQQAYAVLGDPTERKRYDTFGGSDSFRPPDIGGIADFVSDLFGNRQEPGDDIEATVKISFAESILGTTREVEIERPLHCNACDGSGAEPGSKIETCGACGGRGANRGGGIFSTKKTCAACGGRGNRIKLYCHECQGRGYNREKTLVDVIIPPGVKDGAVRTRPGMGDIRNGNYGDLIITIEVEPHATLRRVGADIEFDLPVQLGELIHGTTISIPAIPKKVDLKVPPNSTPGDTLRLRGLGAPTYGGIGKGDLLVHLKLETPCNLNAEQLEKLRAFEQTLSPNNLPERSAIDALVTPTSSSEQE